jgi:predicted ATPase
MKLARVRIENFRHLGTSERPFEIDFTDPLGRVRDLTLLVGPNMCGKTTVLDAIAAALGPTLGMPTLRPHFQRSPRAVVRRGALHARVTCWLRFTPEEIAATRELFLLAERPEQVPDAPEVELTWEYPDPAGQSDHGFSTTRPTIGWTLLKGRFQVARLLATGRVGWDWFRRVGGVFTFDQQRTGYGKTISRQAWGIIHGTAQATSEKGQRRTADPRIILLDLAVRSLVPARNDRQEDDFRIIQEGYARVCAPHRIVGAVRDDERGGLDLRFSDGQNEFGYDGLSSGEQMVLLLLIRMVVEHMHQSIVLIDELELNQHPIWQRRLLHLVGRIGEGNQIIATTHSAYVRDAAPRHAVLDLGVLDDQQAEGE